MVVFARCLEYFEILTSTRLRWKISMFTDLTQRLAKTDSTTVHDRFRLSALPSQVQSLIEAYGSRGTLQFSMATSGCLKDDSQNQAYFWARTAESSLGFLQTHPSSTPSKDLWMQSKVRKKRACTYFPKANRTHSRIKPQRQNSSFAARFCARTRIQVQLLWIPRCI